MPMGDPPTDGLVWSDAHGWGPRPLDAPPLRSFRLLDDDAVREVEYLKAIERHLIAQLADRYNNGEAMDIAKLCDETLDRSGRLLGRVRDVARGVKGWEPLDPVSSPRESGNG